MSLVAYLVAGTFVDAVFSDRYRDVVPLLVPLLAAQVVRGTTSIYNTYLSAHGRGRELRNAGLVLTASNLVLNFALIPPYGAMGAAWASLVALVANHVAHIVFYRRSLRCGAGGVTASSSACGRSGPTPCCWSGSSHTTSARASTFSACAATTTRSSPSAGGRGAPHAVRGVGARRRPPG